MNSTSKLLDNINSSKSINSSVTNESISINYSSTTIDTYSSSSLISKIFLTNDTTMNNELISLSRKEESMKSLVDQINTYRNNRILARIEQCDSNMKLNDICEIYSIDNDTNLLIRQLNIDFLTLDDIFDGLINRSMIENLNKSCLSINQCFKNLSQDDIQLTINVIKNRGRSFCSLEQCQSRLKLFIKSCPTLSNTNISIPTLKLSPMLCTLYNEQLNWNSTKCIEEIIYLLHIFYGFWPQFEKCYVDHSIGFDECTTECKIFDNILSKLEYQCNGDISFLSQVPTLIWYQSIYLNEMCYKKTLPKRPLFIYSVENLFSLNKLWYQLYKKPVYTILFMIIIIILFILSFSLCCYLKSKYRSNRNNRRLDNDYEYTRLHNSSFELGTNSEITNIDSATNELIEEESQLDADDRFRVSEYQRLLFVNS